MIDMSSFQQNIDLDDSHLQEILNLLAEYLPDKRILAFGSRVRHTARPHSDLDLAILDDKPTGLSRLGLIRDAFEASDLPFRVDLLDWQRLTPEFQQIILQTGISIQGA
jgi:type I restriction enzyme S subunit